MKVAVLILLIITAAGCGSSVYGRSGPGGGVGGSRPMIVWASSQEESR